MALRTIGLEEWLHRPAELAFEGGGRIIGCGQAPGREQGNSQEEGYALLHGGASGDEIRPGTAEMNFMAGGESTAAA